MADTVTAAAEQEIATAFALWTEADDALHSLIHEGLLEIRNYETWPWRGLT